MNPSSSSKLLFSLFFTFFLFSNLFVNGQGIQGVVSDLMGATIPNATLIIEEINTGTSSNLDGEYKYNLPKGTYTVRYEAMGFKSERETIVINDNYEVVNVQLSEQVYQLKEVEVVKGEDPAYDIMRKAIASAPFHLNQVKKYSSDIYLRGTLEFKSIPWLLRNQIKVNDKPVKAGDAFSYESVNEIDFQAPDQYQHRVISEHSTFPDTEGNPMPNFQGSFYQPEMGGIISPFSPNAFAYYRFVYEGYSLQDKVNICKIRVIPRRSGINVYDGVIYLVEGCWALHSLDLKNANTYFTASVKFISNPIAEDAWLPISYNFNMSGSILGISGQFDYNGAVKYKSVELNTSLQRPSFIKPFVESNSTVQTEIPVKKTRNQQIIEEISKKEELSNRDAIRLARILAKEAKADTLKKSESLEIKENTTFTKDKDARNRDSLYWNAMRPIPLTQVEKKILQPDTSLVIKTASGKDSIPKKENPVMKALGNAVFGHSVKMGNDSSLTLGYGGLLGFKQLGYNTVDGFVWGQSLYAHWQLDSIHLLKIQPSASYAFSREAFMWDVRSNYTYSPRLRGFVELTSGHSSVDFNQRQGIRPLVNAGYTLLGRQNFMKLYDEHYYSISNKIDLANGLESLVKLSYSSMNTLENTTDFSFFFKDSREFTPNTPNNVDFVPFGVDGYKSAVAEITLFYTPFQHYRISKTGLKMADYSKFPTFLASYKKGFVDVASSNSNFNMLEGLIWQRINMVGSQSIHYMMNGGGFIHSKSLSFADFKHFNTQNIEINRGDFFETFNLLDYYSYSSSKYYFQTHFKYESPYLLLKLLPFFDKQIWSESLRANYLTNEHIKNYCEVGYSVHNIFLMGNLGVFAGFEQGKYRSVGFRLGLSF